MKAPPTQGTNLLEDDLMLSEKDIDQREVETEEEKLKEFAKNVQ